MKRDSGVWGFQAWACRRRGSPRIGAQQKPSAKDLVEKPCDRVYALATWTQPDEVLGSQSDYKQLV